MMIGTCAGSRRRCFHDIEPAHLVFAFNYSPSGSKLTRITKRSRSRRQEVGIKGKNSFRLIEVVNRVDRLAKSENRTSSSVVAVSRFVLVPLRRRKLGEYAFQLRSECWRRDGFSQKTKTSALLRSLFVQRRPHLAEKCRPSSDLFAEGDCLRAI